MATWVWIIIAVAAAVVVLGIAFSVLRAKRSRALQESFGPEYDRALDAAGNRPEAERELRERQKQHEQLDIRPLSPEERERYAGRWQSTQLLFVDDPQGAVAQADALVQEVMKERGYPVADFERRVAEISVAHPQLVEKYRTANGIARASERNEASTDDLRHSVRHYRALFAELLEIDDDGVQNVDDVSGRADADADSQNVSRLR
jgi:hypothetical protein